MRRESVICWAPCLAVALLACGEPTARLVIDLQTLNGRDAVSIDRLEQLRVSVRPNSSIPTTKRSKELEVDTEGEALTFEFELSAGGWHIEMLGEEIVEDEPNATYFGDLRIELEPYSENDVVIPLFPAGTIVVPVWIAKNTQVQDALVTFIPRAPREDQSSQFVATLAPRIEDDSDPQGVHTYEVIRALPTGDYDAVVDTTPDGINYYRAIGEPAPISSVAGGPAIQQGVVRRWDTPLDIY